jgi:ATP-dependent DNA ligase
VAPQQLSLSFEAAPGPRLPARIRPASPVAGVAPFDDDGWFFEPWWPGRAAVAIVEDGRLRWCMDTLAEPADAFPELGSIARQVRAEGIAMAGTLLVLDRDGRPDPDLLRERLADPTARRGVGAFVASDLLWSDGRSLAAWPFAQRRARLLQVLADTDRSMASRGLRGEGQTLAAAVASMGLDAISARRLSARVTPDPSPEVFLRLPVLEPTAPERRPLLVLLQRLPLDDDG